MHIEKVDHIRKATGMAYDHLHLPTAIAFLSALPLHLHFCPPYDYNFISARPTTTHLHFVKLMRLTVGLSLIYCKSYNVASAQCSTDLLYRLISYRLKVKTLNENN